MKPPFKLVPDSLSHDTVECLSQLLEQAKQGKVLGIAFGVMYKGRRAIVNTAGECRRNRIWTRGLVRDLDDELRKK